MKYVFQIFFTVLAASLLLVLAPCLDSSPQTKVSAQTQLDKELDALYEKFKSNVKGSTAEQKKIAYEVAKEYLRIGNPDECYGYRFIKSWVEKYESTLKVEDWKKIVPLVSTCEDVKKIFGIEKCISPITEYESRDYDVSIYFCERDCKVKNKTEHLSSKFAVKLVKAIGFRLKKPIKLSNYKEDLSNYVIKKYDDLKTTYNYINDEAGINLTVVEFEQGRFIMDIFIYPPKEK
jgi:hypothetical protein